MYVRVDVYHMIYYTILYYTICQWYHIFWRRSTSHDEAQYPVKLRSVLNTFNSQKQQIEGLESQNRRLGSLEHAL